MQDDFFKCPECNYIATSVRNLSGHLRKVHPDRTVDVQRLLNYRQVRNGTISVRQETNTKSGRTTCLFTCWHCGFQTKQPNGFDEHLVQDHLLNPEQEYIDRCREGVESLCACGCSARNTWYGWRHGYTSQYLRGHNHETSMGSEEGRASALESRLRYFEKGGKVWNAGAKADLDPRIRVSADKMLKTVQAQKAAGTWTSWQSRNPEQWAKFKEHISLVKRLTTEDVRERLARLPLRLEIISDLDSVYETRQHSLLEVKCLVCNTVFHQTLKNLEDTPRCFGCVPRGSLMQSDIRRFISGLLPQEEVLEDHVGLLDGKHEVDIFVPSRRFAVEVNGLTFHNVEALTKDGRRSEEDARNLHWWKTQQLTAQGIRLLHVFGDEWRNEPKRRIVQSLIRERLGCTEKKLDARKCTVRLASTKERSDFFSITHIDGDTRSTVCWCLEYEGEIVAALSLRHPHGSKYKGMYEIARMSSALDCRVRGGCGKLMAAASSWAKQKGARGLVTNADLRYGDGHAYEAVGFRHVSVTVPRFWWVQRGSFSERFNRLHVKADSSRGLSEREVAEEGGYIRIYGCPNRVLVKDL